MTTRSLSAFVLLAALAMTDTTRAQSAEEQMATTARATAAALGKALKGQLQAALKSGGPADALDVCKLTAPAIAKDLSESYAGTVGRTALKVRNPANAPDDFETAVLLKFVKAAQAGGDPTQLEQATIVTENGNRVFRYMKAIPMATKPCAACHGENIAPDLREKIQQLYPDDQAVGFKPGEIRGAFTIKKVLR